MAFRSLFIFLICFSSILHAEEEIIVSLSTETSLAPLYLNAFEDNQSGFSTDYLSSLRQVLAFDFQYNGSTTLVSSNEKTEQLIKRKMGGELLMPLDGKLSMSPMSSKPWLTIKNSISVFSLPILLR